MKIKSFENFIRTFPYEYQATNISKKNWKRFFNANSLIKEIFGGSETITITRKELYSINNDIPLFIVKVLMWGYATGGRGNNVLTLLSEPTFSKLTNKLQNYRNENLTIEDIIYDIKGIYGLAISTMTKFTHFMNTSINGHKAIILDQQIMNTIELNRFEDLISLKGIKPSNSLQKYSAYIKVIDDLSKDLNAHPDQVEMFLFFFGRTLIIE